MDSGKDRKQLYTSMQAQAEANCFWPKAQFALPVCQLAVWSFPFARFTSACCITEHWQLLPLLLLSMHCILCPLCGSLSRWQQSTATRLESTLVRSWRQAATDFIMQKVRRTNREGHAPPSLLAPPTYVCYNFDPCHTRCLLSPRTRCVIGA